MKIRTGTLAILAAVLTVTMMAFPGSAGAAGQFGDVSGAGFSLPQFGLEDLLAANPDLAGPAPVFIAPPIDLIGADEQCRDAGRFGQVCSVNPSRDPGVGSTGPALDGAEADGAVAANGLDGECTPMCPHHSSTVDAIREGALQEEPGFFDPFGVFSPPGAFGPPGASSPPGAFPPPGSFNPAGAGIPFFIP